MIKTKKAEGSKMFNIIIAAVILALIIFMVVYVLSNQSILDFFKNLPSFKSPNENEGVKSVDSINVIKLTFTYSVYADDNFWFMYDPQTNSTKVSIGINSDSFSGWYSNPNDYAAFKNGGNSFFSHLEKDAKVRIVKIMSQKSFEDFAKELVLASQDKNIISYYVLYSNREFFNEVKRDPLESVAYVTKLLKTKNE